MNGVFMNLHLLHTGPLAVNTYILPLSENEVLVIDPADCPFSQDEGSVISYLASKNLKPLAVILTHGHFDHVSGLPFIKKSFPNIPVVIHKADSAMIGKNSQVQQGKSLSQMGFFEFLPFVSDLPEASAFLEDGKKLLEILGNCECSPEAKKSLEDWQVLHTPGHTEGSCCLYNEKDLALISGDTLFYHSWGRTDLAGGSERKIHQSLAKIAEYCEEKTLVYPGHDHAGFTLEENF